MSDQDPQPSESLRTDLDAGTRNNGHHHPNGFRSEISRDRGGVVRPTDPRGTGVLSETGDQDADEGPLPRGRQRSPGFRRADGGAIGLDGSTDHHQGLRFDLKVDSQGYAWWYIDALSDEGGYGLTIIAFIGSVFSPYYNKSGRDHPGDHCALNVALYGPRKARWAMTEHGENLVSRESRMFSIGKSSISWEGDGLLIDIDEVSTPLNRPIKGQVRIKTASLGQATFFIDDRGKHRWRPLSPISRVEVDLQAPDLQWTGSGYVDFNQGEEPLEDAFSFWDWSRTIISEERAAILYNTDMMNGASCEAAIVVEKDGSVTTVAAPPAAGLPSTMVWRIPRRTRSEAGSRARIVKTLEDTPFYSRSIIKTRLFGEDHIGIHESLSGPRLKTSWVQFLLTYRMPRVE